MDRLTTLCLGAALAVAAAGASASMHQICYEGQPEVKGTITYYKMVVGCSNEAGGTCEINARPASGGVFSRDTFAANAAYVQSAGYVEHWQWGGPVGTLTFDITFKDALGAVVDTRPCSVSVGGVHAHGYSLAEPAVLTSFSTDASGLVTTGVWRNRAAYVGAVARVTVPSGFAAVGGGAQTADAAFIAISERTSDRLGWRVASYTDAVGLRQETPASTLAYAVGMQIRGVYVYDQEDPFRKDALGRPMVIPGLLSLISAHVGSSGKPPLVYPSATGTPPVLFDEVGLGGEVWAGADSTNSLTLRGQYVMTSAPQLVRPLFNCLALGKLCSLSQPVVAGWRAESTDDVGGHPGNVTSRFLTLPRTLEVNGQTWEVRGGVVRSTVAASTAPAGTASGLRGQYALTGVGAEVQWRRFQPNPPPDSVSIRLASLQPQAELGGGSATTRQGTIANVAALDVYGIGIKLVKPGTPPETVDTPIISVKERAWLPWLCQVFEGMAGWPGCEMQKSIRLDALCASFPDLPEYGVCTKQ